MDKRSLESFVAVYRSGSLVEAAERLNISQSALSRRITELQHRLGLSLFESSGRGLAATSEAQNLLPLALTALEGIAALEAAARVNGVRPAIHLTVTATAHMIETVVADCIADFVRTYPNVRIGLLEAGGVEIEDLILSGKASLGITARPRFDTGLIDRPIVRLNILAGSSEPFTPGEVKNGIELRALCRRELLILDRRYQSRLTLDAALRLLQLTPNIMHEGSSASVILALARVGLGTAVMPSSTRTDLYTAKITANGVALGMDLTAIWDPTMRWRAEVEELADSLRKSFSTRYPSRRADTKRRTKRAP
ncbi:LysR family transcriptional regulator [Bradyrhizobium liaoningense]|uniref:LysR family transcriptional regulator n=1 Tax=Bradyrhizobium liaoningense TaxID=43992 RepID=UPI001BA8B757|nr:LysR family transcriptional regulator [Bradyrhizobium liaoningense]MBR0859186.1 LysR family transcriptional regulator [Bradyrhizobium liaoningense]